MGGPHVFGFPAALRKAKATPVQPIPQTPSVPPMASDLAAQDQNDSHISPSSRESRAEHNHVGIHRDLRLGSVSAMGMATDGGTLVAADDKELGQFAVLPKASSQLLGNQDYETSHNSESNLGQTARSLRGHGSSSTLRSFYDAQKIPLAVSQQTSNSSARDFALRKGCPSVVAIEKPVLRLPRSEKYSGPPLKSMKKTSSIRLDLSMLFPKPSAHHDHLLSSRLTRGQSNIPNELAMPPAVPLGPGTSQKPRRNTVKKASHRSRQSKEPVPYFESPAVSPSNMRKPASGLKYWFDSYKDEDLEDFDQHENVEFRSPREPSRPTCLPIKLMPTELEAHDQNADDTFVHHKMYDPGSGNDKSYVQMPPAREPSIVSPAREQLRLALQNWESRSKHHRNLPRTDCTTQFRKSRTTPSKRVDLQKNSVLWLSSSDEESGPDDSLQSDIGTTIPGIRDSLIVAPLDSSDVEIGTAHAIMTERPRLKNDLAQRKNQSYSSRIFESPLTSVQVPERQSSKMFSFLSDQSRSLPNTHEDSLATSSIPETPSDMAGNYLHNSTTASQKHHSVIRLMTVTPQEESLLEAIRSKRDSMRQNIIVETFRRTAEAEQGKNTSPNLRPRTSGLESNPASFLRLSQDSVQTLSAFHSHRRSISVGEVVGFMEPRNSGSTDLTASHSGSLAHSSLPSTSSQESPATPTLEPELDNSTRRISSSTKRYSTLPTNYQRHSRVRTGSSAVIVLDNLDEDSSSHFKLDDLPIWAFNGWPNTPGLAIVH